MVGAFAHSRSGVDTTATIATVVLLVLSLWCLTSQALRNHVRTSGLLVGEQVGQGHQQRAPDEGPDGHLGGGRAAAGLLGPSWPGQAPVPRGGRLAGVVPTYARSVSTTPGALASTTSPSVPGSVLSVQSAEGSRGRGPEPALLAAQAIALKHARPARA